MLRVKPFKEQIQLEIEEIHIPLEIYYDYRMSVRISLVKNKAVLRLPILSSTSSKEQNIAWAKQWIQKKFRGDSLLKKKYAPKEYHNEQVITVLTKSFTLIFKPQINRKTVTAQLIGTYIKIILPLNITPTQKQKACSTVLSRIFSEYFSAYVKKRVDDLNDIHFKKNIGEINMRHNHSNWGSCSSSNNISLSSRLLLAPDFVLDYIIIHELAHLIEHNHSHRFWDQVERAMPNYMEAEKWLKKFGDTCHW